MISGITVGDSMLKYMMPSINGMFYTSHHECTVFSWGGP